MSHRTSSSPWILSTVFVVEFINEIHIWNVKERTSMNRIVSKVTADYRGGRRRDPVLLWALVRWSRAKLLRIPFLTTGDISLILIPFANACFAFSRPLLVWFCLTALTVYCLLGLKVPKKWGEDDIRVVGRATCSRQRWRWYTRQSFRCLDERRVSRGGLNAW